MVARLKTVAITASTRRYSLARIGFLVAVIGASLAALSLSGDTQNAANSNPLPKDTDQRLRHNAELAQSLYVRGDYLGSSAAWAQLARICEQMRDSKHVALAWNNAGGAALAGQHFRDALTDFTRARSAAESGHHWVELAMTMQNLASLYTQLEEPAKTAAIASEALHSPAASADAKTTCSLGYQLARATMQMKRTDEGIALYHEALECTAQKGTLDALSRMWSNFGGDLFDAGRIDEADAAFTEGLRQARIHRLNAAANALRGLARVRAEQGRAEEAGRLFDAALAEPPGLTPKWLLVADRADFRLRSGDTRNALSDYREARRLIHELRADIVPADQDRVALETGVGRVIRGLIEAGNLIATETHDRALLRETFDYAEQDRLWSLRAMLPSANDWRSRLPETYWDLLARYQALERSRMANGKPDGKTDEELSRLSLEMSRIEASVSGDALTASDLDRRSPLEHAQSVLDQDSVLLSFHAGERGGWLWIVTAKQLDAFPIPPAAQLKQQVEALTALLRRDSPDAVAAGRRLYADLFGNVPPALLSANKWRIEPDGPLHQLPFAALVSEDGRYLVEKASLSDVPGVLLMERGEVPRDAGFVAVGDPVYNGADSRYRNRSSKPALALARLPNTADEIRACSRAWGSSPAVLLEGDDATEQKLRTSLGSKPAILHFATHVLTSPGDYSSGLIALSLNTKGEMDLLGPEAIAARASGASLVVMNGCHSAQADALPGAGLMGLTRSWIASGARAVLATEWDIPDQSGTRLISDFYAELRRTGNPGDALRDAQIRALHANGGNTSVWAGYSLLSRF